MEGPTSVFTPAKTPLGEHYCQQQWQTEAGRDSSNSTSLFGLLGVGEVGKDDAAAGKINQSIQGSEPYAGTYLLQGSIRKSDLSSGKSHKVCLLHSETPREACNEGNRTYNKTKYVRLCKRVLGTFPSLGQRVKLLHVKRS